MKVDRCPTCHRRYTRSTQANALYWLLLHRLSEQLHPGGKTYSPESYHTYYKSKYLGCDEVVMPNGKAIQIPRSTANLDVAEFGEFFDKVQADAAERGVWLEEMPA